MAARTRRIGHTEEVRAKIQASQLVNRLQDHVLTGTEMSKTQITAATTLLDRVLPRLQTVDGGMTLTHINHEDALSQLEAAADEQAADVDTTEVNGHSH